MRFRRLLVKLFLAWMPTAICLLLRGFSRPAEPLFCHQQVAVYSVSIVKILGTLLVFAFFASKKVELSRLVWEQRYTPGFWVTDFPDVRTSMLWLAVGLGVVSL